MKTGSELRFFAALCGLVIGAASTSGETTLLLDIGFGIRYVPASLVTVPTGEQVTVIAPDFGGGLVQWFKNGQPVPGATERALVFQSVTPDDAGIYHAIFTAPEMAGRGTQSLVLGVKPTQRLVNLSTRAQVGAGEKTFVAGFVVTGEGSKKIIVRAIGPALAQFGINEPVLRPAIAIFDKDGNRYTASYYYLDCVGCLTYEQDLAESLAKVGAFPVTSPSANVIEMRPFTPGAYTVHVTSSDGTPGVVLLEVYEVP